MVFRAALDMEKAGSGKSAIYILCQCFLYAFIFGGGIFQVAGGQTSFPDAASLISRLIFHVFTALLKNMIIAID